MRLRWAKVGEEEVVGEGEVYDRVWVGLLELVLEKSREGDLVGEVVVVKSTAVALTVRMSENVNKRDIDREVEGEGVGTEEGLRERVLSIEFVLVLEMVREGVIPGETVGDAESVTEVERETDAE